MPCQHSACAFHQSLEATFSQWQPSYASSSRRQPVLLSMQNTRQIPVTASGCVVAAGLERNLGLLHLLHGDQSSMPLPKPVLSLVLQYDAEFAENNVENCSPFPAVARNARPQVQCRHACGKHDQTR